MITYVVVLLVVVGILYGSFRALGGVPAAARGETHRAALRRVCDQVAERAAELDAAIAAAAQANGDGAADPLAETAGGLRRQLSGYRQHVTGLETSAQGDDRERLEAARALLVAAIEDVGWACRLVEGGGYRDNPGIAEAVAVLRAHGERCRVAATGIVETVAAVAAPDAPIQV